MKLPRSMELDPTWAGEVLVTFAADGTAKILGEGLGLRPGGRYMTAFVPIGNDEGPDEELLPPRHKVSNIAAMLCKDPAYIRRAWEDGGCGPVEYLYTMVGISSRRELDTDPTAAERFREHQEAFAEAAHRAGDGGDLHSNSPGKGPGKRGEADEGGQ